MKFTVYGKESFLFPKLITEKGMKKGFNLTHVKKQEYVGRCFKQNSWLLTCSFAETSIPP